MGAVRDILNILEFGRATSTYKFALLRSIVDYIFENPNLTNSLGFQLMPLFDISKRFLEYYWQLKLEGISQASNESLAIWKFIDAYLKREFLSKDVERTALKEFYKKLESLDEELTPSEIELLVSTKNLILRMPLKYIKNVNKAELHLLSVCVRDEYMDNKYKYSFDNDFLLNLKNAKINFTQLDKVIHARRTWEHILETETGFLVIANHNYAEIQESRVMLRDSISLRWIKESLKFSKNKGKEGVFDTLFSFFDLKEERDAEAQNFYRDFYKSNNLMQCIYTGESVERDFHLDHLLPFSYYPVNYFWNLYPISPKLNLSKSNLLPELNDKIIDRIKKNILVSIQSTDSRILKEKILLSRNLNSLTMVSDETAAKQITDHIRNLHSNLQKIVPGNLWKPPRK
jgi:hypothetical protein